MKRVFIAIKIAADRNFRKLISDIRKELATENIKWVDPENIHITLAFLGDTDEDTLHKVDQMLGSRCKTFSMFELSMEGFGIFRSLQDPRIIWAGIYHSEKLNSMHLSISQGLKELGVKIEDRPFSPHLTIGRIKHVSDMQNLKVLLLKYRSTEIQKMKVREFILYESRLRQEGPDYIPLAKYELLPS